MSADADVRFAVPVDVREVRGARELEAALDLRREVFVGEQGVVEAEEEDGRDGEALHVVAVDGARRVIGTCRLLDDEDERGPQMRLGRMVVAREHRRSGVGRAMLTESERIARDRGARRVVLHAQVSAMDFYGSAGYEAVGEPFLEARIEHVTMELALA